jgi:hypothetical protein
MKLIFLFALPIFLISCLEKEAQPSRAYIYPEIKNEFVFNPGSYWVYEDEDLNLDSIVLGYSNKGFTQGCPEIEYSESHFYTPDDTIVFDHYFKLDMILLNGGGTFGSEGQPIYIYGKDEGFSYQGITVGATLDSLEVLDQTFYNVSIMHIDAESQVQYEFEFDTDIYFSPNFGIIKTITYDTVNGTQVKNLLRYHIEV